MFKTILHLVLLALIHNNEATDNKVSKLNSNKQSDVV